MKAKVSRLLLLAMVLALSAATASALAQEGPVTATGVLGEAYTVGQDPTLNYDLTDEVSGTTYALISGFVDLQPYVGRRVTVEGVPVPGAEFAPPALNVTSIAPAGETPDEPADDRVTLAFELAVKGQKPPDLSFFGFVGGGYVQLADPDGDGLYTGTSNVPQYGPGPRPVPEGTEPVTLSVQIVQATEVKHGVPLYPTVIEDFGDVLMDEDKTFSASVSFDGMPVEPPVADPPVADPPVAGPPVVDQPTSNPGKTIRGTDGPDNLSGTRGDDYIIGLGSDDTISEGYGNDLLRGDGGADEVVGGYGADEIYGGDGNDRLDGGADSDIVSGDAGDDRVDGGSGDDLIVSGDEGNDAVYGYKGNDTLYGGPGDDELHGGEGADRIECGPGDDVVHADDSDSVAADCEVVNR